MGFEGVRENFVPVLDSDNQWGISNNTFKDNFGYKQLNKRSKLIEPIILVVLGGIIGVVLIAMYLPIFLSAGAAGSD